MCVFDGDVNWREGVYSEPSSEEVGFMSFQLFNARLGVALTKARSAENLPTAVVWSIEKAFGLNLLRACFDLSTAQVTTLNVNPGGVIDRLTLLPVQTVGSCTMQQKTPTAILLQLLSQ